MIHSSSASPATAQLEPGAVSLPRTEPGARPGSDSWLSPLASPSYALLLLFILLLYSNVAVLVPQLENVRPAQWVAVAAVLALFHERTSRRRAFHIPAPEGYLMLAFLGAAALSCLDALWPRLAVESMLDLAKIGVVYFLILNTVDDERRLRGLIGTMVVGGLIPAVGALRAYLSGNFVEGDRAAWIGIFGNPNDLAFSLVLLVPLAAGLGAGRNFLGRFASLAVTVVLLAAIAVSFSRGGMLGLFAVLIVMGLRQRSAMSRVLAVLLLASSLIFVTHYWTRDEGFSNLAQDETFSTRVTTMKTGLAMFADRPLVGVGINCSVVAWPLYAPGLPLGTWLHNHNTFTQVLSETGLMGAIPYFLLLVVAFGGLWAARREGAGVHLSPAIEASMAGFVVCALSGGYLMSWFPYLILALASSLRNLSDA